MTIYPFELSKEELPNRLNECVDTVFKDLSSDFLFMPKGPDFLGYPIFANGYETLKRHTQVFRNISGSILLGAVKENSVSLIVIRTILGFTPPEWAHVATEHCPDISLPQEYVRRLDRTIRANPENPLNLKGESYNRLVALTETAAALMTEVPLKSNERLHRLDKADTSEGPASLARVADLGIPYAMLLYERFLGRPFAGHRDSVSELIGDVLEIRIENTLQESGISYRKTKKAEKIAGFDQAPDFLIPDEYNPEIVIEAKIAEDDGTARDKVTRVQHLAEIGRGIDSNEPRFELIACIGGRGFRVRREDMKKLIQATQGKVFTSTQLNHLIEYTKIKRFKSR